MLHEQDAFEYKISFGRDDEHATGRGDRPSFVAQPTNLASLKSMITDIYSETASVTTETNSLEGMSSCTHEVMMAVSNHSTQKESIQKYVVKHKKLRRELERATASPRKRPQCQLPFPPLKAEPRFNKHKDNTSFCTQALVPGVNKHGDNISTCLQALYMHKNKCVKKVLTQRDSATFLRRRRH